MPVRRISQGSGMMLLTDAELARDGPAGCGIGGRGVPVCRTARGWDGSAQPLTPDGKQFGWRHLGMDQLAYALEDVLRGVAQGIRSILVADEGLLWLVDQAKTRRAVARRPGHQGVRSDGFDGQPGERANAGAGRTDSTVNVASDISLAKLAALRQVVDLPVDLYIEGPDGLGGFMRYYEVPELIRVGAPLVPEVRPAQRAEHLPQRPAPASRGNRDRPRTRAPRRDCAGTPATRQARISAHRNPAPPG